MKSFKTIISAGFLASALALAGCGGGGSDDDGMEEMPMEKTPQEMCAEAGNTWYEDDCHTAEELHAMGVTQGEQNAADAAAADQRMKDGKKFLGLLSASGGAAVQQPLNSAISGFAYESQIGDAEDGKFDKDMVRLMILDTKGDPTQADNHDGSSRDADNTALIGNASHVQGSMFAVGSNELKEHDQDDEVSGTYMGAAGTFTCSTAKCTSRRTDKGVQLGPVAGGTGTWTFVPNANSKYQIPDDDYASYGWWLDERTATTTARVGAWYTSDDDTAITLTGGVANSSGKASYTGEAIGVATFYHRLGEDANVGGAFMADANLTADFDKDRLEGSITNFDIDGFSPDWMVKLNSSVITPSTGTVTAGTGTTTWTTGGEAGDALDNTEGGGWSAQFYDIPAKAHQPTGVAGGFKAQYESDGYMVGAFGAEQ